jgi:NADH dehydrogenase
MERKKVVIIGAGFGGLNMAKELEKSDYQVILLDKNNFHTFQPLLYQVASGGLEAGNIAYPVRRTFRKVKNFSFKMCKVEQIVPQENKIITTIGEISYHYLVLAQGSNTNFFGNTEIESNSLTLKSVADALDFRSNLMQNLEWAINARDEDEVEEIVNVAIVGGGPAGLEMAGAIAEMKNYVLPKDYPELNFKLMHIVLFEAGDKLLAAMSANASEKSLRYLQKLGVEVRLNTQVKNYDGHKVELADGSIFKTDTLMWTAGVKGNSISGLEAVADIKGGRVVVDEFNHVKGYKNIFAIGDIAIQVEPDYPKGVPMLATTAIQQGKRLAENFVRVAAQKEPKPYHYHNKGVMATIGRNKAVADIGKFKFSGAGAWFLWMGVHIYSLVGFRNKVFSLVNWSINYFNYDKPLGLIIRKYKKSNNKIEE